MSTAPHIVVGIDEVGRGCVVGPLVVGAVANVKSWSDPQVRDSKRIKSEKRKSEISKRISDNTLWSIAVAHNTVIDESGISVALVTAMIKALDDLKSRVMRYAPGIPIVIIVDGNEIMELATRYNSGMCTVKFMPRADATVFEVGSASIIAKVARDNWCHEIVKLQPTLSVYDIDASKGYGTETHTQALIQHGLSQWHRKDFCKTLTTNYLEKKAHVKTRPTPPGDDPHLRRSEAGVKIATSRPASSS